jgi:Trypsin-like peptidase domain
VSRGRHLVCVVSLVCVLAPVAAAQAPAGAPPTSLHVLKISAGPAGKEADGMFLLSEERTIFGRDHDREAIVMFEWEGAPGPHKLVAQWRSPDGNLGSTSAIEYVAKSRRFGAYWRLPISPGMPVGTWSIETTVDGQPAGRLTIDIRGEPVVAALVKRPLAQAELYERLNKSFVVIERTGPRGRPLEAGAGFVAAGRVYTSLATVDATETLHAVGADGKRHPLTSMQAWNRRQDWAVLVGGPALDASPPAAADDAARVGDRLFSMEGGTGGGRVLTDANLTGQNDSPSAGRRMIATILTGAGTVGAPVSNEYGEIVGIIGGGSAPGATRLMDILHNRAEMKGVSVIPLNLVRSNPDAPAEALSVMFQRGDLVLPITGEEHVVSGGFAKAITRAQTVQPSDQREQFSKDDKTFVTYVNWNPQERLRGQAILRVSDAENRTVIESKPGKLDVRKGQRVLSSWTLPVPPNGGIYRVDTLIDGKPIWRGFVRISQ